MDSRQFIALCDQQFQEGSEQAFAPDTDIMHELKEAQIQRQFFLFCKFSRDRNLGVSMTPPRLNHRLPRMTRMARIVPCHPVICDFLKVHTRGRDGWQ